MISFKQFLSEKAMHRGSYESALKRIGDSALIGFEIEVVAGHGCTFYVDEKEASASNAIAIRRFDTLDEFDEFFMITTTQRREIDRDFGDWLTGKQDDHVEATWEEYVDDDEMESDPRREETRGRKAALNDFDDEKYDWSAWFADRFNSAESFVREYDLSPRYGWHDDSHVYGAEPASTSHWDGWKKTASQMAESLKYAINETVTVNKTGYSTWNLVQDTSIKDKHDVDYESGMEGYGVEIISPPLKAGDAFPKLERVLAWLERNGFETNESTGLHINMSLDDESMDNFDPLKLVLFMGDKYVLSKFNRLTNTFTKSQLSVVIDAIQTTGKLPGDSDEIMALAKEALKSTAKYYSVNLNHMPDYLEFRAAGGSDYHKRLDDIQELIGRYLVALEIACNPKMERQEYLKKVVGLLDQTAITKDRERSTKDSFNALVARNATPLALHQLDAAETQEERAHAMASIMFMLGSDAILDRIGQPTFDQLRAARMKMKSLGLDADKILSKATTGTLPNTLRALKLFKLVK